jgi:hypothetical protein
MLKKENIILHKFLDSAIAMVKKFNLVNLNAIMLEEIYFYLIWIHKTLHQHSIEVFNLFNGTAISKRQFKFICKGKDIWNFLQMYTMLKSVNIGEYFIYVLKNKHYFRYLSKLKNFNVFLSYEI